MRSVGIGLIILASWACDRPRGEGALFRSAAFAGEPLLEVHGELDPGRFTLRKAAALGLGEGEGPRVVVATVDTDLARTGLERLGIETSEGTFRYLEREFDWRTDVVVAVWEDPTRPGLPWTLVVGSETQTLAPLAPYVAVGYRSHLMILRDGTPILEASLRENGSPRLGTLVENRPSWLFDPAAYQIVEGHGLAAHASRGLTPEGVLHYLERCAASRQKASGWFGLEALPAPRLVLEVGMDELPSGMVWDRLARSVRAALPAGQGGEARGGQIHGLLVVPREGTDHRRIDDGGAALVENDLRSQLGPCAHDWMPEAAGIDAAGAWFGLNLEHWAEVLGAAAGQPIGEASAQELLGREALSARSPHWVMPLRALAFRSLRQGDAARLPALWRGESALPEVWNWPQPEQPASAPSGSVELPNMALGVPLFGVRLGIEVGSIERGAGSRLSRLALNDLSEAGGRAALIDVFVPNAAGLGSGYGLENPHRVRALDGDVAVCLAAADARARDLHSILCAHLLTSPEGTFSAGLKRTRVDEVQAFFEEYRRFAEHAALLARCIGVELLALGGEGTSSLGDTHGDPENTAVGNSLEAELREARRAGWDATLEGLRDKAGTRLTWVAPNLPVARSFGFWGELDCMAVPFRPEVGGEAFGKGTRGPLSVTQTRARMRGRLEAVARLAESLESPWLLVGLGFRATSGAWRGEFGGTTGELDVAEQRRLWRSFAWAYHQAAGEGRAPDGLVVDRWQVDLFAPATTRSYDVRGKRELWPLLRGVWRP